MNEILEKIQNLAKTVTTVVISLLALASSGFILKSVLYPQSVAIDQISIPASFEERGIKNEILIQRILDEIQKLRAAAKIDRSENAVFEAMNTKPDAEIDTTVGGVSIKSLERLIASTFDRSPKKISGEIVLTGDKDNSALEARIRMNNQLISERILTKENPDKNLEIIIKQIAFDIYAKFEPFRAALAATRMGKMDDARHALRSLIVSEDLNDRKYALWLRSTLSPQRQAELDLLDALSIDPKFTLSLTSLAALERDRKNYPASLIYADRAIESNPTSPMGYHEKGRTLRAQGQLDAAIVEFTRACSQKASYAPCFNQMGDIYLIQADQNPNNSEGFRKAYNEFSKAIKADPTHDWAYSNAAFAAMRAGDLKDAQLLIKRARELDGNNPAHIIRYAAITYRLGNKEEGQIVIKDLLPSIPNWEQNPPPGWGLRSLIREIQK